MTGSGYCITREREKESYDNKNIDKILFLDKSCIKKSI